VISPGEGLERIAAASVYVLPSIGEIVPMTVLEAMAAGTPTVVTEDNGLAETLRTNEAGIVTRTDVAALADGVRSLLVSAERRRTVTENALKLVRNQFSPEAVADRLETMYA
jgi:glycosyltransferase involved in cell wall biosynthesis